MNANDKTEVDPRVNEHHKCKLQVILTGADVVMFEM